MGDEFLYEVFVVPFNYVWDPTNFNIHTICYIILSILYYIIKLFHAAKSLYVFSVHYVVRISSTYVPDAYADW